MSLLTKKVSGKKTEKILGIIFIPLGIFAVLYLVFAGMSTPHSSSTAPETYAPDKIDLHIQAQQFVLQALKSPSTAKFPTLPYEAVSLGDGAYRVSSYVDSQNSFGATIRSDWQVKMFLVKNHWFLDHMVIDGKVMYDATSDK